jgi:hypothetical protein
MEDPFLNAATVRAESLNHAFGSRSAPLNVALAATVQLVFNDSSNALPISGGYARNNFAIDYRISYYLFTIKPISARQFTVPL